MPGDMQRRAMFSGLTAGLLFTPAIIPVSSLMKLSKFDISQLELNRFQVMLLKNGHGGFVLRRCRYYNGVLQSFEEKPFKPLAEWHSQILNGMLKNDQFS